MKPGVVYLVVAILALASALVLSACGESEGSAQDEQISVMLDAKPNPNHAGIYMAQKRGYFEDVGLDVTISPPPNRAAPLKQVAAGGTDLAIAHEPELILAKDQGEDVIAVASVVNSALTSLIWLGTSGVNSIAELRNRVIAFTNVPYEKAYLETALADEGLTIDDVDTLETAIPYQVSTLRAGSVDAILGVSRNLEGEMLRARDDDPVVDPIDWIGVPTYDELVLVAQRERLEQDPESIRLFLAALVKGTEAAKRSRKATAALIREVNPETLTHPQGGPEVLRAQIDDTLPLLSPEGRMGAATWDEFIAWMHEKELIEAPMPASDLLTNEYLPG